MKIRMRVIMFTPPPAHQPMRHTGIDANRMPSSDEKNLLGTYLKNRRAKLDPAAFGLPAGRRRTPGLRREEVAQRANVSATWYTWLEQGRGGTPSADVLERIAGALALTAAEREHLFLLAQHRPPEVRYEGDKPVSPQLQRLLDSLELSPALVRNATWDVVAWNRAATVVLTDYAKLPPARRNILRLMFCEPRVREHMANWAAHAHFMVATFRSSAARAGAAERVAALVDQLATESAEFAALWCEHDVREYVPGTKHLRHTVAGPMAFDYSAFIVDGRPDLGLVIYTPATPADAERVRQLLRSVHPAAKWSAPGPS
jgi:transcriptional regulator with XRE-family HTH domain